MVRRAAAAAAFCLIFAVVAGCADDHEVSWRPLPPTSEPATPTTEAKPRPVETASVESIYSWSALPIGAGGFVTGIDASTDRSGRLRLVARTDVGGAYRWEQRAERWEQMLTTTALDGTGPIAGDSSVASLVLAPSDPDVLYAAVGGDYDPSPGDELPRTGRVLRSDDGGRTWTASALRWFIAGNQGFRTGTERLAVDPDDPDHVLFGSQREGLWQSHDGGRTWSQIPLDVVPAGIRGGGAGEQAGVNMVAFVPTPSGTVILAGVANHGLFVSADNGATWDRLEPLGDGEVPSGPAVNGSSVIVPVIRVDGGTGRLVRFDATTGSTTPLAVPASSGRWNIAVDPRDARRLVLTDDAVRDGHLWTSVDGGANWIAHDIEIESPDVPWLARTDVATYMAAGRFVFDPTVPGRVWFAEGMGVWRTDDVDADTVTWTLASVGMEITVVSGITALADGDVFVTVADRQGFLIDPTGAYPQRTLVDSSFASGASLDVSASDPSVMVWAGAESHIAGSPDREVRGAVSFDGGSSWREMSGTRPDMYGGEVAISATDSELMAWLPSNPTMSDETGSDAGVYISHDAGRSWAWQSVTTGPSPFHRLFWWFTRRALAADSVNGGLYLLSDGGEFFVGSGKGTEWSAAPYAPPCSVESDCHVYGQLQAEPGYAEHLWASVGTGGLYRTEDAGRSAWARVPGVAEARAFAFGAPLEAGGPPAVYVYGRVGDDPDLALWRTGDFGESWEMVARYPADLPTAVNVLEADPEVPGRVYVGFAGSGAVVGDVTLSDGSG